MKHIAYIILFVPGVLSPGRSTAQKTGLTIYKSHFDNELRSWRKTFNVFSLSSFKKGGSADFEDIEYMDFNYLKEFYSIYKPALTFSMDKSQFIDIYSYWLNLGREGKTIVSYGGEADQAITLCNFKTKKWTRIFFRGTTERIQEVIWVTNSKFILAGVWENTTGKNFPVIYIGDTINKTFESFVSGDNKSIQKRGGYDSPKLLSLNIKEK